MRERSDDPDQTELDFGDAIDDDAGDELLDDRDDFMHDATHPPSSLHPGITLLNDYLLPLGISKRQLAEDLAVPVEHIAEIINGRRSISPEMGLRLGLFFDISPSYWVKLQIQHDLWKLEQECLLDISSQVKPHQP